MESSSNWADLPEGILSAIFERLFPFVEYTRSGCVCRAWLSVAEESYRRLRVKHGLNHNQIPLLLMHQKDLKQHTQCSAYSIITGNKVFDFSLPMYFAGDRICGSSQGWLAIADSSNNLTLHNPIRDKFIFFPPVQVPYMEEKFGPALVKKVIVSSSNPCSPINESNYFVVAHFGYSFLAYMRSGDVKWTEVDVRISIADFIFCDRNLLLLGYGGELVSLDVDLLRGGNSKHPSQSGRKYLVPSLTRELGVFATSYLAESSFGGLLLLRRMMTQDRSLNEKKNDVFRSELLASLPPRIACFIYQAFELKVSSSSSGIAPQWVEIKSLSDQAVFLGDSDCVCVDVSGVAECKPNCINYSNDRNNLQFNYCTPLRSGSFSIVDRSFREHIFDISEKGDDDTLASIWISLPLLPKFPSTLVLTIQKDDDDLCGLCTRQWCSKCSSVDAPSGDSA